MTTARHGDSDGVTVEQFAERAHLVDADVARQTAGLAVLEPLEQAEIGMASGRDQPGHRMIVRRFEARELDRRPAASASTRVAAALAKVALPTPLGPASSQAWCSRRVFHALSELLDRPVLPDDHGSRSPARRAAARSPSSGVPQASISLTRSGSFAGDLRGMPASTAA